MFDIQYLLVGTDITFLSVESSLGVFAMYVMWSAGLLQDVLIQDSSKNHESAYKPIIYQHFNSIFNLSIISYL